MNKIKIISALIFTLLIVIISLAVYGSEENKLEIQIIQSINKQKDFTQEISKNIFYTYKNQIKNDKQLETKIKTFMFYMKSKENLDTQISPNKEIIILWNEFYLLVQKFRDRDRITSIYSSIILEDIVNDIYKKNLKLIVKFDNIIELKQRYFSEKLKSIKNIQYSLFLILLFLLVYLFSELKLIIAFIQKFLNTSKGIISNASIKGIQPIEVSNNKDEILQASNNFNLLVSTLNESIANSTTSIEQASQSLELLEENIEDMLNLIYTMQNDDVIDKDFTKKEDAVIQSLEELSSSTHKLQNLKIVLNDLITHSNLKK